MKKRFLAFILAMVMMFAAAGCTSQAPAGSESTSTSSGSTSQAEQSTAASDQLSGTYSFNVGSSAPEGSTIDTLMKYINAELETQANGQLEMIHYGASQLGSDADLVNECLAGNVPVVIMTTASLTTAVPELAVFDMYCAIPSTEVFMDMMNDQDFVDIIQGWFEKAGLHLILWCPSNYKQMATTKQISTIEDFKGFSMRTLANKYHINFWEAVGANTVQITASELYLSIQQGLVEGLEMDMHGFIKFNVHEVVNYIVDSRLLRHMTVGVMNLDAWNSMSSEDQAWFNGFLDDANEYYAELGFEDDEHSWQEAEEAGVERIEFNQDLFDSLKEVAEESVWKLVREDLGDAVVDDFLDKIKAAEDRVGN